jgi:GT2 family glycosyltransferase
VINDIFEINTDNLEPIKEDGDKLWENRQRFYSENRKLSGNIKVTIVVQAYNQIEKLRYSLECLSKYTPEDLYELILVDNGSEPEVMEFYKSIEHPRVKIIRITKNISSAFPQSYFIPHINGEYTVWVFADTYVTKNWLENLLACMESDKKIGIAAPMASYSSNLQDISVVNGKSKEEIQEFAANFNISDPKKWHQDLRVISLVPIIRSEIWYTVGLFDTAYYHDLGEDDLCIRIRRAGYKIYVCRDTFIYHDHVKTESDRQIFPKSLLCGFKMFNEKWNIEPWDDILYGIPYNKISSFPANLEVANLLCIDPRLGKPIFTISNYIKMNGGNVEKTFAFTSEAKFYSDLINVADDTKIGTADNLRQFYSDNSLDIICLCEPLDTYSNPKNLLKDMTLLLKEKGLLFFHINNSFDISTLLECFGITSKSFSVKTGVLLSEKECENILEEGGCHLCEKISEHMGLSVDIDNFLKPIFQTAYKTTGVPYDDSMMKPIKTSKFHYTAVKE